MHDLATDDSALLAEWAELAMKAFTDTPYEELVKDLEKMIVAAVGRSTAAESAVTVSDESKEGAARAGEGASRVTRPAASPGPPAAPRRRQSRRRRRSRRSSRWLKWLTVGIWA